MDAEWIRTPTARRILAHWADRRPAWLWSSDGQTLLWRNPAARLFNGKLKKHGLRLAPEAVPIKGQISRLLRLGSPGRASLSRIQFLAGGHPASATCTVTPLEWPDRKLALLIVAVDPVAPELLEASDLEPDDISTALLPEGAEYLVVGEDGELRGGSDAALEAFAPLLQGDGMPGADEADSGEITVDGDPIRITTYRAAPQEAALLLFEPLHHAAPHDIQAVRAEEGVAEFEPEPVAPQPAAPDEPLLPMGLPPLAEVEEAPPAATDEQWPDVELPPEGEERSLSSLFDRLAEHEELYTELPEPGEAAMELDTPAPAPENSGPEPEPGTQPEEDVIAAVIAFSDDTDDVAPEPVRYRVVGRGFSPLAADATDTGEEPAPDQEESVAIDGDAIADAEVVERVSRYNFDELSRILADRVSNESSSNTERPGVAAETLPPRKSAGAEGALVNLAAETFILNRLPIGIMVFRDQQVLFANRALTDLTGYDSIDGLRAAGLAAIFPQEAATAGPVTHLLRREGTQIPVTARLQSITWHGRPALMLSASLSEARFGQEGAVRGFAETLAEATEDGFITADRAGVLTLASLQAGVVLGRPERELMGQPLTALIYPADVAALREFLEQPARFAETARPSLTVRCNVPGVELLLFAEGQAGIVTGYFGYVRRQAAAATAAAAEESIEPSMLARISRGVRRPLNTIIGFADLIRSSAFGTMENQRYLEYARDIKAAGQEIAVLVDELDDFARLCDGRYTTRPAELDLGSLLESCVVRVRGQASAARVLVRSGISERLPRIRADRASLGQAVLNLLASAIDQTPPGGSVVLSAQIEEDGSIAINVRDSSNNKVDLGDRFVVFRDGVGKDGEALAPVRSSVGLSLTRALLRVNACSLTVAPTGGVGTLFMLSVPADLVAARTTTA